MDQEEYLAVLHVDALALAAAARRGLDAPVPSCPGWYVADLVLHTGAVHRAQARLVGMRARQPEGIKREMFSEVPGLLPWFEKVMEGTTDLTAIPTGLIRWFEEGAVELERVLRGADPEEPVWSWSGNNRVAHYLRMMPIETAVHRWDAQLAHDCTQPIDTALARDGIDQTFDVMLPARRQWKEPRIGSGETYHFHRTDGEGEWLLRFDPEDVTVTREHAKGDVAVRGTASDLFLFLWGRLPAERLDVHGDAALLERYFALVPPL